jgi:hypothetical protein
MYEENCKPLAQGDVSVVFAEQLAEIAGSNQTWFHWKAELEADHRWIELLY